MFGIEFSVSAGRCTKGLFAQLIPVNLASHKATKFHYILVIDTEGLRAPELNITTNERDNELATLALGLSDVTIINIKGENTTEIKDTLQIAMHAFLRMKVADSNMKTKQRCVFVHNNVSAVSAADVLRGSQNILVNMLQDMFEEAAKQVGCDNIRSYKDILDFEVERHVRYLSDLWYGDPPMAPINPGYVERVTDVKQCILNDIVPSINSCLTISDFGARINDLWKAVLAEDFIFSFRNSLEARVYEISMYFLNLKRKLGKRVTLWVEYNAKRDLITSNSKSDLGNKFQFSIDQLGRIVLAEQNEAEVQLEQCFSSHDWKYIADQWRQFKINELKQVCQQIRAKMEESLRDKRHERDLQLIQKDDIAGIQANMLTEAKRLAEHLKSKKVSEVQLEAEFNEMWNKVCHRVPTGEVKHRDIAHEISELIAERYVSHHQVLAPLLQEKGIDAFGNKINLNMQHTFPKEDITKHDIKVTGLFDKVRGLFKTGHVVDHVGVFINEILRIVEYKLKKQAGLLKQFEHESVDDILDTISQKIEEQNEARQAKFKIRPLLEMKLAVHVCRYAYPVFFKQQDVYDSKNSITAKVEAFKQMCYNYFQNAFKNSKNEVLAADMFCDIVKQELVKSIKDSMPPIIVDEMVTAFATKHRLIVRVLKDLIKDNSFDQYMRYIQDPACYAEEWIDENIGNEWFVEREETCSKYELRAQRMLVTKIGYVRQIVDKTFTEPSVIKHMKKLVDTFCHAISSHVPIACELLESFASHTITDVSHLHDLICRGLQRIELEIKGQGFDVTLLHKSPCAEIMKEIWGCRESPFCNEPCSDSTANHGVGSDHSCVQHKPEGINGRIWTTNGRLVVNTCSFNVHSTSHFTCFVKCQRSFGCKTNDENKESHAYRDYRKFFKDWHITPSSVADACPYWCWFMYTFRRELTDHYKVQDPEIPESWSLIDKDDAVNSLMAL